MKKKLLIAAGIVLISGVVALANSERGQAKDHLHRHFERIAQELDLTSEQQQQVQQLETQFAPRFQSLHEQEFESKEARREAMHDLRNEVQEALNGFLTATQQQQLANLKGKHRHGKQHNGHPPCGDKGTWESEVEPEIRAKRQKFDTELSADEKAIIANVRVQMDAMKEEKHANRKSEERPTEEERKAHHTSKKQVLEPLMAIVEAHQGSLDAIHDEIKTLIESKCGAKKPGKGQHPEGGTEGGKAHHRGEKGQGEKGMARHHMTRFLLMDPNAEATSAAASGERQVQIYPNPAKTTATISYSVIESGMVRVELLNKDGQLLKTLTNGTMEAGDYEHIENLDYLKTGEVYFIRVTDQQGSGTGKFIVVP